MNKTKGRILIIRGGDVSEFILTCPVFAALREQFPETSLEILGYPRIVELAKSAGLVDEVRSIETRAAAGFFGRNMPLDEDLASYFASFSMIFSYLYDPDGHFQINVGRVSTAQFVQGPARPNESESIHAADAFLKPLERLAIFGADSVPRLNFSPHQKAGSWVAINPGRDNSAKTWPGAKWSSLVQLILEKTGYNILLTPGDAEEKTLARLAVSERVLIARNSSLMELGASLAGCHAFIGPDSGILQLAAATGIPCVAIWGTSNVAIWKPPGKNVTVLRNRLGVNAITQDELLAALPMVWSGAE